ncbi:HNH endonuclease [Maribacter sp.]|nr:HNH endonuclease [Maribacter sp.]
MREYYLNNKDAINTYKRERYNSEEGKALVKAVNQERRSKKRSTSDGTVTGGFIIHLLKEQNYKCAISGKDISNGNYHLDHVIPLSKGGTHTSSNIQLLQPSTNMSKKDSIYEAK